MIYTFDTKQLYKIFLMSILFFIPQISNAGNGPKVLTKDIVDLTTEVQLWSVSFVIIGVIAWGLAQKYHLISNGRASWGGGIVLVVLAIVILKAELLVTAYVKL